MDLAATREALATALASTSYSVYKNMADNYTPPCVVLDASSPYIEVTAIGNSNIRANVTFDVTIAVAMTTSLGAQTQLDSLIGEVLATLSSSGIHGVVGNLSKPYKQQVNQTELYVTTASFTMLAEQ